MSNVGDSNQLLCHKARAALQSPILISAVFHFILIAGLLLQGPLSNHSRIISVTLNSIENSALENRPARKIKYPLRHAEPTALKQNALQLHPASSPQTLAKAASIASTAASAAPPGSAQSASADSATESDQLSSSHLQSSNPDYFNRIRSQIESSLRYPLHLRQRKIQGHVQLQLTLNSRGEVQASQVIQSSGYAELDRLALQAITDAAPFPPIPPLTDKKKSIDNLNLKLPIDFRID